MYQISKQKGRRGKKVGIIIVIAIIIISLTWGIFVFSNNSYIKAWRNIWIETAMSTTSCQFLATSIIPASIINDVISQRVESEIIHQTVAVKEDTSYFDSLLKLHKGDKDPAGNKIYVVDTEQEIVISEIKADNYTGKIAIIGDASRVFIGTTKYKGTRGQIMCDLLEDNDAILGINASGFYDANGSGSGGAVVGAARSEGEDWGAYLADYNTIAFDEDDKLIIGLQHDWDKKNIRDACQFNPVLIANGEQNIKGTAGWGLQPRTAVGQREDGTVFLLIVDGRQPGYSIGATMEDLVHEFQKYDVLNAAACDGGSSSIMGYNGELITKCSSPMKTGRYLPNAFLVRNIDNETVKDTHKKKTKQDVNDMINAIFDVSK